MRPPAADDVRGHEEIEQLADEPLHEVETTSAPNTAEEALGELPCSLRHKRSRGERPR